MHRPRFPCNWPVPYRPGHYQIRIRVRARPPSKWPPGGNRTDPCPVTFGIAARPRGRLWNLHAQASPTCSGRLRQSVHRRRPTLSPGGMSHRFYGISQQAKSMCDHRYSRARKAGVPPSRPGQTIQWSMCRGTTPLPTAGGRAYAFPPRRNASTPPYAVGRISATPHTLTRPGCPIPRTPAQAISASGAPATHSARRVSPVTPGRRVPVAWQYRRRPTVVRSRCGFRWPGGTASGGARGQRQRRERRCRRGTRPAPRPACRTGGLGECDPAARTGAGSPTARRPAGPARR